MSKIRLAALWFDGCSGCYTSLLDMDQRLIELADQVELVYGPLVDVKRFPEAVDITLAEGAISTSEDVKLLQQIRQNSRLLVSFGDCAVTANVPSMRNPFGLKDTLETVYLDKGALNACIPDQHVPRLLERARPVHHLVPVDLFIPGCPPSADTIYYTLSELIAGRMPDLTLLTRFGA